MKLRVNRRGVTATINSSALMAGLVITFGCNYQPPSNSNREAASSPQIVSSPMATNLPVEPRATPHQSFTEKLGNGVKLEMVAIPGGAFMMGSPNGQGNDDEYPQHRVTVSPFYIGKYEVTQAQWKAVMGSGNNPSYEKGDNLPVEPVSWNDAGDFCKRLSTKTGKTYRLPTEAEWEYAARAGSTSKYSFGDDEKQLGEYAWFKGNSGYRMSPVGQKKPNAWGLFDMHGNIPEWCQDWYGEDYYQQGVSNDPQASSGEFRVVRGGSRHLNGDNCRSSYRDMVVPFHRGPIGLRVVVSTKAP